MKEKLDVLYISAMGPREQSPNGGIFVTQRICALRKLEVNVQAVSLALYPSKIAKSIMALRGNMDKGRLLDKQLDVEYEVALVKCTVFEMIYLKWHPQYYTRKIYNTLRKVLREEIDLIHLHWFWPIGLGVKKITEEYNIPYVITCHGSEINFSMQNKMCHRYMLDILEHAAGVEFVSNALLQKAISLGYSGRNAVVSYNGIDTKVFYDKGYEKKKFIVGFVGNLIPVKGADRLPTIFRLIFEKLKDNVEFVVIGSGALEEELKKKMGPLPVVFTGQISPEELAEQYARMSILVVPSRLEGYPCVIAEAQACGVVVIGNDVGGISEAIGTYGVVLSSDNEDDLIKNFAEKVIECMTSPLWFSREQMIEAGKKKSWEERQQATVRLYKEIMKRNKGER